MEFYAASKDKINPIDMEMFGKIQAVLNAMPDIVFEAEDRGWRACKNQVSCHLICRALVKYFEATVCDGYFVQGYQHSWLVPKSGSSIIDAYPVAGAVPFIVAKDLASPWVRLYKRSDKLAAKFVTDQFCKQLEQTTQTMEDTIRRLGLA